VVLPRACCCLWTSLLIFCGAHILLDRFFTVPLFWSSWLRLLDFSNLIGTFFIIVLYPAIIFWGSNLSLFKLVLRGKSCTGTDFRGLIRFLEFWYPENQSLIFLTFDNLPSHLLKRSDLQLPLRSSNLLHLEKSFWNSLAIIFLVWGDILPLGIRLAVDLCDRILPNLLSFSGDKASSCCSDSSELLSSFFFCFGKLYILAFDPCWFSLEVEEKPTEFLILASQISSKCLSTEN